MVQAEQRDELGKKLCDLGGLARNRNHQRPIIDLPLRPADSAVVFFEGFCYIFHRKKEIIMPAIKPISELRNYNTVLREVTEETPVFLTKNGRGRFAIVDIRAYERLHTELELMSALAEGEESARKSGWVSMDAAMKKLGV